jgi:pSer/pThr/pTyr-binding forkhead associated (FHA) protein
MDDVKQPAAGGELPLQGPHYPRPLEQDESPSAFIPLKLLVHPSGPVLELTRSDMLMGRHSEADVRLPLPDVSRRHCRFLFSDNSWHVLDLDSLNGVFVNGERVQHASLRDGDVVTIGSLRFEVDLDTKEVIHRLADATPRTSADNESQRKAS